MSTDEAKLAQRIAQAIREHGFFVFDRELDPPEEVLRVLRRAHIDQALEIHVVDQKTGIYILLLRERGCRRICVYERGCREDKECLKQCVEECLAELRKKVAGALEQIARRSRGTS
jgi:hypothetical protein